MSSETRQRRRKEKWAGSSAVGASVAAPDADAQREHEAEAVEETDDPRTTDALKGYVLQAYHYLATGESFCEGERCRLSNPHRQPGVVAAQLRDSGFCDVHAKLYEA